jgi:hypothetical protein
VLNDAIDPADRERLHSTKGGDSETELNELAVSPTNEPSAARAVTMVTPVANMPKACRNWSGEKLGGSAWGGGAVWRMRKFTSYRLVESPAV